MVATTLLKAACSTTPSDRWFFTSMSIVSAVIVFIGFGPTYYLKTVYGTPALPSRLVHLHGMLLTAWIVLFLIQTTLIASNRANVHRRLGVGGAALAIAIFPISLAVAIAAARSGGSASAPPIPPLTFMAVPVIDLLLFSALVSVGLYNRHRRDVHKRLMLLGTFALLSAAVGRFFLPPHGVLALASPLVGLLVDRGFTVVLVVLCILYDLATRRRVHPAFLWGGLFLLSVQHFRLAIGETAAWLVIADWLVG